MRVNIASGIVLSCLLLFGCAAQVNEPDDRVVVGMRSVETDLRVAACKQEADMSDPNETPYLLCPGVAGYSLIVRRVEAGRRSIEIVDAAKQAYPLDYQEFVTRHMFTLGDTAEWRVSTKGGSQVPMALIVRVNAQENNDDPAKTTQSYIAIAKIEPNGACVIESIPEGTQSEAEIHRAADAAREKPCAPALPE